MTNNRYARLIETVRSEARESRSFGFNITTPRYQIGSPQWPAGHTEAYAKAFKSQAAVYACVLKRANAVSQAPLRVYKESDGDADEQPTHELRKLLARPNPMLSEAEFYIHTMTQMDAVGFAAIEIERAVAGNVIGLWHLRPDWLTMVPQPQKPPRWEYRVAGNPVRIIPPEEIIVISGGPSTDLKPIGMPPIEVALREVGINDSATDFLKIFIDTGGVPRVALETPHEIKDQAKADAIREKWSQVYGGYKNWSQIALLHGGMTVKDVGISLDALAYPALRALLETHICAVYGVPPIVVGIQAGLDASTYSNYVQARRAFFEDTVTALWSRLAGAIGRALLPEYGDDSLSLAFDTSRVVALQEDETAKWNRAREALSAGGVTLNQFQSIVGLPGFGEDGDVLLMPFSVQATRPDDLGALADLTAEPPAPVPAALAGEDDDEDDTADDDEDEDDEASDDAEAAARAAAALVGKRAPDLDLRAAASATRSTVMPVEMRARVSAGNRRQMTRLATQQFAVLVALFRKQGERVAAAYSKRAASPDMEYRGIDDLNELFAVLDDEMQSAMSTFYQRAGDVAYRTASRVVGVEVPYSAGHPNVRRTLRELAGRVVGINAETRANVQNVVTKGIEAGKSHKDIAADLRGLYDESYKNRSLTISRTESQVAYNMSTADAYKASGRVMAMILHDNPRHTDDRGSDGLTCAQRDGVITDVDAVRRHIYAEHPNGTLATSPLLIRPLGSPV